VMVEDSGEKRKDPHVGLLLVTSRLNKKIQELSDITMSGLIKSAMLIRRDMEVTSPLTPVDTGNLRASFFTTSWFIEQGGFKVPFVALGYTAYYAPFVHEKTNPNVQWSRPGSGPKWFQEALKRNHDLILKTIKDEAKRAIKGKR